MLSTIASDPALVAHCGLYCGACRKYLKGNCPGCHLNEKASWCKVRSCCQESGIATCAECKIHADLHDCRYFHNFISRILGFVLRSDRFACIDRIGTIGPEAFAAEMADKGLQTIRR